MIIPEGEVLGVTYFGPVEGTPLIPPGALTYYFLFFTVVLFVIYLILHHKKRPPKLLGKIKLLALTAISLKLFFLVGGSMLAAYWLLPSPAVLETSPTNTQESFPLNQKIEVLLDRPVSRSSLQKIITPEVAGVWIFENSLYQTHFYRKLVFYPTQSLKPNTEYQITLSNIRNALKTSPQHQYSFNFKTQPAPEIMSVNPANGGVDHEVSQPIEVNLTEHNDRASRFAFDISPSLTFNTKLDDTQRKYTLTPTEEFKQGTKYTLTARKIDLVWDLAQNTIIEEGETKEVYKGSFTTREAPGIESITPSGVGVFLNTPVKIIFGEAMDPVSVEENLTFDPSLSGKLNWLDDKTLEFTSGNLSFDTTYTIKISKGTKAKSNGFFEEDLEHTFTTIGKVKVSHFAPADNASAVAIGNPFKVTFDQEVDRPSAQSHLSVNPSIAGKISWDNNTLIFTPDSLLTFNTIYKVAIAAGVKSVNGLDSTESFTAKFTTQQQTVKLGVPAYLQQHSLSCELAALKMVLAFRGINISEESLLAQVGVDNTPHVGNTWGNPYTLFVGNVDGRQMVDGYGVYWGPIARVARNYRQAQEFESWNVSQLTTELVRGNPVVIWAYSRNGSKTSWNTPGGQYIYAVRGEHAVTVVGFVGPVEDPTQIIVNDPLVGQVYWPRSLFDSKWASFNQSGVVIY